MPTHWTEDLFVDRSDVFATDLEDRLADAPEEVEDLLALLDAEYDHDPDTALDVACGIGRHSVTLADRGVDVTGIDLSEPFLARARELATDRGVADRTEFRQLDMRDLDDFDGRYDLLINVYTSFGFFDDATNESVLSAMYDRTASGGVLALELVNKDGILADFRAASVDTHAGYRYVEEREYDPKHSRMHTRRYLYDPDTHEFADEYEYDVRLYTPAELTRSFERVGFEDVSVFESLDGEEVTRESTRMVVLGQRG